MLEVEGISKSFGTKTVFDDLSFRVQKGHIAGFVGPNGAGKTTVMNAITGYVPPDRGRIKIAGCELGDDGREYRRKYGYLPEHPPLYPDMTVYDYLKFVYEAKGLSGNREPEIARVLEELFLSTVKGRVIKHLSKGFRQRLGIAQAMLGSPPLIILDEPTIGLDPNQMMQMRALLHKLKERHTILISSHILSELTAVCDEMIFLHNGKILLQGTAEELIQKVKGDSAIIFLSGAIRESVKKEIMELSGVQSCQEISGKGALRKYRIEVSGDALDESKIAKLLISNGVPLYELGKDAVSLEEVFRRYTTNEMG